MAITTEEIIQKYNTDIEHVKEVENYCQKIVGALTGIIDFTEKEKDYLKNAALLHDIGYAIEKKSHHKHSFDLIMENQISGYSNEEVCIIANIARYHRNSLPDENRHFHFANLSQEHKCCVEKLASILRIADGMDKPHKNLILRIEAKETEESFEFYIKTIGFKPNLDAAKMKSDLFEKVFKKTVNFTII